jgi:hypothetical protein
VVIGAIAVRYYFDIRGGGVPVRDNKGKDFDLVSGAILHAKSLADDLRAKRTLIRPEMHVCVISESGSTVHKENLYADHDGLVVRDRGSRRAIAIPDAGSGSAGPYSEI